MDDFSELLLPESTIHLICAKDPSLITDAKDGSREISLDLLGRNSPDAYQGTLSSSAVSVAARYITVPTAYDSERTLEFVGFTAAKAQELFQSKRQREQLVRFNIDIEKWAMEYGMAVCQHGQDSSNDWIRVMRDGGVNDACPVTDRRTMEIRVPVAHFEAVRTWYLKPEDAEFKRLVFFSRRDGSYPKDLSEERRKYGVIHGPMAHASDRDFEKMRDWTEVKGKYMLQEDTFGGTEVVKQYAWVKEEAIEQLTDDCVGKVYIRQPERHLRW